MKEEIRRIVMELGADVCGVASAADFQDAPEGYRPTDVFKACRSVVVFGVALPKGALRVDPRLIYQHFNGMAVASLDEIAFRAAREIERRFPSTAVPVPSDGPYDAWNEATRTGHGLLSVKHLAKKAGVGAFGKSGILLNARYGARLNLGAILTDIPLASDPPAKSVCVEGCRKCIEGCPAHAINEDGTVNQKKCRALAYGKNERGFDVVCCNRCRASCAVWVGEEGKHALAD